VGNYFNHAETGLVALAAVMFVISQIVILWPAGDKRAKSVDSTGSAEGKGAVA
jgi:hypothetical protein